MAGFKQTIRNMDPVLFITFDGENFDAGSGNLDNPVIQDESRYQNNGIFHLGNEPLFYPPGYRAGRNSLVDLESTANYSMAFGYYGYQAQPIDKWQKAFVEVINQTQYKMEKDLGSFAITFMYNRDANEQNGFRDAKFWSNNQTNTNTLSRMIVRKAGMVQFRYVDVWAGNDYFELTGPDNKIISLAENELSFTQFIYRKNTFFSLVYTCEEPQVGTFACKLALWVNGIEHKSIKWQTVGAPPVVDTTASWELMGTINPSVPTEAYNDRHTTMTTLDQLAVFNKRFTPTDVMDLYRKSRLYDDIVRTSQPNHYYKMDDVQALPAVMYDKAGDWESGQRANGEYIGSVGKIANRIPGPKTTYGALGTAFQDGGMAVVHSTSSNYSPVWNPSTDFWSFEFWFRASNNGRSVLYSNQSDHYPFRGHLVQLNWRNNTVTPGAIEMQFADEVGQVLASKQVDSNGRPYNFNDNQWHHLCVVREGQRNKLYLDGVLHAEQDMDARRINTSSAGQMYFMGMMPERLFTNGEMCNFATYNRSLQLQEVQSRVRYSQLYRVKGFVTLFGNSYAGTVRAYNHGTGELVASTIASSDTGAYSIDLPNNDLIDLTALNPKDPTIRYRSYGPITPAQVEDAPR